MDLFGDAGVRPGAKPLTVFHAELLASEQAGWEELVAGFTALKAITFSSSVEMLIRLADRLDDMEIVFGSEAILSREHLALTQASQTIQSYGFADALVDQKALVEALSRLLSLAAFEGRQHEVYVAFDGAAAWTTFDAYYQRDWKDSVPVEADALVAQRADGELTPRDTPLALEEVPIVRVLNAGLALVDAPPRPMPAGFAADALRTAAALGADLKDLALPKDKAGRTVMNAASVLRVIRSHQARPLADATEDRIPRADIDFSTGTVHLDGAPWLHPDQRIPAEAVAQDARLLVEYLNSFLAFFGNAAGAVEVYWAFLVWLYAVSTALEISPKAAE